jgi:hypothetical protein
MKDTNSTRTLDFDLVGGRYVTRPKEPCAQPTRAIQTAVTTPQVRKLPTAEIVLTGESDGPPVDLPEPVRLVLKRIPPNVRDMSRWERGYQPDTLKQICHQVLDDLAYVSTFCRQQTQLLMAERRRCDQLTSRLAALEFEEHVRHAVEQRLRETTAPAPQTEAEIQERAIAARRAAEVADARHRHALEEINAKIQEQLHEQLVKKARLKRRLAGVRDPNATRERREQQQEQRADDKHREQFATQARAKMRRTKDRQATLDEIRRESDAHLAEVARTYGEESDAYEHLLGLYEELLRDLRDEVNA